MAELESVLRETTPHQVTLAGKTFVIPDKMPPMFLIGMGRLTRGDVAGYEDALRSVLGDQLEDYLALPDAAMDDVEKITEAYGMAEGESSASKTPSGVTGGLSRPTSNGSTASTWGQPSSLPSLP